MFNFFANLAVCIYYGQWLNFDNNRFISAFINYLSAVPIFGLFNNSTEAFYSTSTHVGNSLLVPDLAFTIAVILSTICCISVFFIIVKAIKKLFTCFLGE